MRYDFYSRTNRLLLDGIVTGLCFYLAYLFRYGGKIPPSYAHQVWTLILPVVTGRLGVAFLFGAHRIQWRYFGIADAIRVAKAYVAFSSFLMTLGLGLPEAWQLLWIPPSVIAIDLILSVGGTFAIRLLRRSLYERKAHAEEKRHGEQSRRLLLIGAGLLGSTVAKELASRPGIKIVGFLDDNPRKVGALVAGIRVLGPTNLLTELVENRKIDDVLVCIPPASRHAFSRLWVLLEKLPIRSRFVPTIDEIMVAEDALSVNGAKPRFATSQSVKTSEPEGRIALCDVCVAGTPPRRLQPKSEIRDRTIVITGGAGFIGSSLAQRLVAKNQIVLVDRFFKQQPISFTPLMGHPNVRVVEADIMNEKVLRDLAQEAEIVVHAAAIVGVGRVCNHSRETLEINFVGTSRVLQSLESSRRLQRVVYFSTSEVFGVNSFRVHENSPSAVGPAAEARWSYSIAKLAGEHLVQSYYRESGMPVVTVRPFNIFGPRRIGAHAISQFVLNALTGRPVEVNGDGSQIRSWCYIEDFCDALIEMIVRPEAIGEDFNIGNPRNTLMIHQLAQKIIDMSGAKVPLIFTQTETPDVVIRVPSLEKAQSVLGYQPKYDLDPALKLTIEWYERNLAALDTGTLNTRIVRDPIANPPLRAVIAATGD